MICFTCVDNATLLSINQYYLPQHTLRTFLNFKMPFIQRHIEPSYVSKIVANLESEEEKKEEIGTLSDVNIVVLTNIIQQLSSISEHATSIINNITDECVAINNRTEKITERVQVVAEKIGNIPVDTKVNSAILEDPPREFPNLDEQLFTSNTRPKTVKESPYIISFFQQ